MMIAQQLYEGVDVKKEGTIGLITYIRTDSTRISQEAVGLAKDYILDNYGKDYSNGGKAYDKKSKKDSQDAHESIRPTSILRSPNNIKSSLTQDQFKLYNLIWQRFTSSQMSAARYDTISVTMLSNKNIFKASGSKLNFDGFLKVYDTEKDSDKDIEMPMLEKDEKVKVNEVDPKQHFTQPRARYTEASLIKILEELGIGRPSTYSPTISTILNREYVNLENKSFKPTELGGLVNDLLEEYFKDIINEKFTADLEEKLDKVAEGEYAWQSVVDEFYKEFHIVLKVAEEEIEEMEIKDEVTEEICEKCGKNMVIKHGRYGKFLACPGYPECKNTKAIVDKIDIPCPICDGEIIKRKSKKRRVFYGCSNFPDCNFISWDKPIKEKCPKCKGPMTERKRKNDTIQKCLDKECGYSKVSDN